MRKEHPGLIGAENYSGKTLRHTHVPAELKRNILEYIWQESGPALLLSIGGGIREAEYDPIWRGALCSKNPKLLFEKWQRFEKFSHSTNRVRINQINETTATFQRYTSEGGIPSRPENFLICGLIISLLEEIGYLGLRCEMGLSGGSDFCIRKKGRFHLPQNFQMLEADSWWIEWREFKSRASDTVSDIVSQPISSIISTDQTVPVDALVKRLLADISHQWKVEELAHEVGLSKRSLQRKLGIAGLNFSNLVRLVRIHEACSLLAESDAPLTSIAFCTGFSDSAHFSRDFRASMGMTPTDYRAEIR